MTSSPTAVSTHDDRGQGRSLGWLEAQHTPDDVCFYAPHR